MATATRRVGRPRTRADGPGDYVGFRAPRELKERLEAAASRSARSLSTEAQIRLEKSFERQDLLGSALELAYGPRLAGILLLTGEIMSEVGKVAGFQSSNTREGFENWIDDPFAYNQAIIAVLTILAAFRPSGDPNILRKNGKEAQEEIPSLAMPRHLATAVLEAIKAPERLDRFAEEVADLPLSSLMVGGGRLKPAQEEEIRRLLGPLRERIESASGKPEEQQSHA